MGAKEAKEAREMKGVSKKAKDLPAGSRRLTPEEAMNYASMVPPHGWDF
jgi:hypothetical protein